MPQSRIFADTDEKTARALMGPLEELFELDGLPVSAFENPDDPARWSIAIYAETGMAEGVQKKIEELALHAGLALTFQSEDLPETDWVAATLRDLSAVRAGRFIVHGGHEAHIPRSHEIAIQIDAGLAFGTGHHGTTAGCLDMLTRVYKRRKFRNVLDLGTGSGVLAIAAAKLATARVLASDIDPIATQTANANAHLNSVHSRIECITAVGFTHPRFAQQGPFDLIIANILARPLQMLAHDLVNNTAPGGTVILSGLLPHQRAPLVATYRLLGLYLEHHHVRDGWLVLVMRKP